MKKRNKKWAKEKKFRGLKEDLRKNWEAQKDLGWVELETPIFKGWTAKIEPREDIQNREDAWVFWWISKNISTEVFSRKIENFPWIKKRNQHLMHLTEPTVRCIDEKIYNSLDPQIRKHFYLDSIGILKDHYKYRFGKWYICSIPEFYWKIIYVKTYKTKAQISDGILLQEEAEIKYILNKYFYIENNWYKGAPRHFRNSLNRIQRRKAKEDVRREIHGDGPRNTPNYKNAKWLWW